MNLMELWYAAVKYFHLIQSLDLAWLNMATNRPPYLLAENLCRIGEEAFVKSVQHYIMPHYWPTWILQNARRILVRRAMSLLVVTPTVADNQLDLKFINNSASSIYITSYVSSGQITVQIFGKRDNNAPNISIIATNIKELENSIVKKPDPEIEEGKEVIEDPGHKGFLVTTYRIKTINGEEISREFLASDEFPPVDKMIKVGTKRYRRHHYLHYLRLLPLNL